MLGENIENEVEDTEVELTEEYEPTVQEELNLTIEENTEIPIEIGESSTMLTTETQTLTSTTSTDVQTDIADAVAPSPDAVTPSVGVVASLTDAVASSDDAVASSADAVASSADAVASLADATLADAVMSSAGGETTVTKREMSIQTELENAAHKRSIATDPMISSQSMESLLSGVSAPPYHNRRAGNSFSTQSLSAFEHGRSRSPVPRSSSAMGEIRSLGRGVPFVFQDPMAPSWTHSWLSSDPMYYKPHALAPSPGDEYYDGNWGSMDRLNRNAKKTEEEKWKQLPGKPRYHKSLENLKIERVPDPPFIQCLKKVKDAERCGYSVEDLQVAYFKCRNDDPIFWLQENWDSLVKNLISLAAKCAEDNEEHDVGAITPAEAKYSLHKYRGNIWEAVAECIEFRQRKILELTVRGNFTQKQIVEALKNNDGNVELAYADLIRATSKLFKHILSPGLSEESEDVNINVTPAKEVLDSNKLNLMQKQDSTEDEDFAPDKKRSDFLNKLTAVREAQSERRKAREEKELCRDTDKTSKEEEETNEQISSAVPEAIVENISEKLTDDVLKEGLVESVELQPSVILEHSQFEVILDEAEQIPVEEYTSDEVVVQSKKEDELPEDFDGHWVDSQGEWIEEFSDEQWDEEGEGEWVTVRTRYKKMDDELDAEALEMAALWEKEELADDVFEDEPKQQKLTPEKDLELKDALQNESESRWSGMDIPPAELSYQQQEFAEDEFEMDANDNWIVKDTEKLLRSPENEMSWNEDDKTHAIIAADESVINENNVILKLSSISRELDSNVEGKSPCDSLEGSIGDEWEKVETHKSLDSLTEELKLPEEPGSNIKALALDTELDQTNIADAELAQDSTIIPLPPKRRLSLRDIGTTVESQKLVFVDFKPIQPENATEGPVSPAEGPVSPAEGPVSPAEGPVSPAKVPVSPAEGPVSPAEGPVSPAEVPVSLAEGPIPPVRRKSKLNDSEVKQIFEKYVIEDVKQAPNKVEGKLHNPSCFEVCLSSESPVVGAKEPQKMEYPLRELSPGTSFSGESDSNCFADSESEHEVNARKLKKHHHRSEMDKKDLGPLDNAKKIDLEQETFMDDDMEKLKFELEMKSSFAKKAHHMLDDDEEPMYRPFSGPIIRMRSQESTSSVDEGLSPKAYREGVGRPLQLFKDSQQASFSEDNAAVDESIFHSASDALVFEETQASEIQGGIECKPPSYMPEHIEQHVAMSPTADKLLPSSQIVTGNLTAGQVLAAEAVEEVIPKFQPGLPQMEDAFSGSLVEPEYHESVEELPALSEMEATSSVADYFYGRYNEITVTRKPKKKPILIKGPGIKPLSTNAAIKKEASPLPSTDSSLKVVENKMSYSPDLSLLSKSAVATDVSDKVEAIQPTSAPQQTSQVPQLPSSVVPFVAPSPSATPVEGKPPESSETLSFAEDYFFGSYNVITVQKKPKKKPIPFLPKSAAAEFISTSIVSPAKKTLVRSSSSENIATSARHPADSITQSVRNEEMLAVQEHLNSEQQPIEVSEANASIETAENVGYQADAESMIPLNKHAETMNQASPPTTESPRITAIPSQQVEAASKIKSVTFGQTSEIVAPPPRGKKIKKDDSQISHSIQSQSQPQGPPMSAADEYLYGRYDEILSQKKGAPVSKKKLLPSIEDLEKYSSCVPCDSALPITYIKPLSEIAKESLLSSGTDSLLTSEIQLFEVGESVVSLDSPTPAQDILEVSEELIVTEEKNLDLETSYNQLAGGHVPSDLLLSSVSSNASENSESWLEIGVTSIQAVPVDGADDSTLYPVATDNGNAGELQTAGQLNVHFRSQDNVGTEILHDDDVKTRIDSAECIGYGVSSDLSMDEMKTDLSKEIGELKAGIEDESKTSSENLEMNLTTMSQKISEKNYMTDIKTDSGKDSTEDFPKIDLNLNAMQINSKTAATDDIKKNTNEMTDNFEIILSDRKSCSENDVIPETLYTMDIEESMTVISSNLKDEIIKTSTEKLPFDDGADEIYTSGDSGDDVDEIAEGLEADLDAMDLVLEKAIDETEESSEADLEAMDLVSEEAIDETDESLEADLEGMDLVLEEAIDETEESLEADLEGMDLALEEAIDETEESLEADLEAMDLFLERTIDEAQDGAEFSYTAFEEEEKDFQEENIDFEENEYSDDDIIERDKNNSDTKGDASVEEKTIPSEENIQYFMSPQGNVEDVIDNVLMGTLNDKEKGTEMLTESSGSVEASTIVPFAEESSRTEDLKISAHTVCSKLEVSTEVHQLDENGNRADTNENFITESSEEDVQEFLHEDSSIVATTLTPQATASTTDQKTSESEENYSKNIVSDDFDYGAAETARDAALTEDDEEEEESSECTTIFIKSPGIVVEAAISNMEGSMLDNKQSSLKHEDRSNDEFPTEENVLTPVCDKLIEEESVLQGTCEELENPISSESQLIIDVHLSNAEVPSRVMSETEKMNEILNAEPSSTTSLVESEEKRITTIEEISEKDETSELNEEVPYDDSYSSVISRFYEEFIESAHPYSSAIIEDKRLSAYSSSFVELEDSYNEISDKPLKGSLQQSECSNDSFDSIEEIEMYDHPSIDFLPLLQEVKSVKESDLLPISKMMDSSIEPDELDFLSGSDFIHKTHKQSEARADQQILPKTVPETTNIAEKSQLEISMLHQEIKVFKSSELISKSSSMRKRSVITIDQSCQTELDTYEDDQYYDTLDDDLLQELIQNSADLKCALVDTGIQCQIINGFGTHRKSIDNTTAVKSIKDVSQTMTYITKRALPTSVGSMQEKKSALSLVTVESGTDSISKCDSEEISLQESNSFESLADDDSDIFIEMANSESDDSNVPLIKGHLRLIDIDSGTGSISGSDTENMPDVDTGYSQAAEKFLSSTDGKYSLSSEVSDAKNSMDEKVCKNKSEKELLLKKEEASSTTDKTNVSYSTEQSVKSSTLFESSLHMKNEETMEKSKHSVLYPQQKKDDTDVEMEFRQESFGDEDESSFQSLDKSEADEISMSESIADSSHQKETRVEIAPKLKTVKEKEKLTTTIESSHAADSKDKAMLKCIDPSTLQKKVSPISELSDGSSKDESQMISETDVIEISEPKTFTYVTQVSPPQPILRIPSVLDIRFIEIQHSVFEDVEEKKSSETEVRASSPTVEYFLPSSSPEPSSASEDSSAFKDALSKHVTLKSDLPDTPSATPDICPDVFIHMDLPSSHSEDLWEEANSSPLLGTGENFTDTSSFFTDKSSLSTPLDSDQCSTASGSIDDFELPGLDNSSMFETGLQFHADDDVQVEKQVTILAPLQGSEIVIKTTSTTFDRFVKSPPETLWSTPSTLETGTDNFVISTKHDVQQPGIASVYDDSQSMTEILSHDNSGRKKNEDRKPSSMVSSSRIQKGEEIVPSQLLICDSGKLDEDEPESEMANFSYHSAADASEESYGHSDDESEEFLSSADENIRRLSLLNEKAPSDVVKYFYYDDTIEFDESETSGADFFNAESDSKLAEKTNIPSEMAIVREEAELQTGFPEISQQSSLSSTDDVNTFHSDVSQAAHDTSGAILIKKDKEADTEAANLQRSDKPAAKETVVEKPIISSEESETAGKPTPFIKSDLQIDSTSAVKTVDKLSSITKESDQLIQTNGSKECNLPQKEQQSENAKTEGFHDVSEHAVESKSIQNYNVYSIKLTEKSSKEKADIDSKTSEFKILIDESIADIDEFSDVPSQSLTVDDSEEFKDVETEHSVENFKDDDFHYNQDEEDSLAMLDFEEISVPKDEPVLEFISAEIPEFELESNLPLVPRNNVKKQTEVKQYNPPTEDEFTDVDSYIASEMSVSEELEFSDNLAADNVIEILTAKTSEGVQKVDSSSQKITEDTTAEKFTPILSETCVPESVPVVLAFQQPDSDVASKSHDIASECQVQPLVLKKQIAEEKHEVDISVEDDFADIDSYIPSEISLSEEHDHSDHSITCDMNLIPEVQSIMDKQIADQETFLDTQTENIIEATPLELYESILDPFSSSYIQGHSDSLIKSYSFSSEIKSVAHQASFSTQVEEECHDLSRDEDFTDIDSYVASEMSVSEDLEQSGSSVLLADPLLSIESVSDIKIISIGDKVDESTKPSSLTTCQFKPEYGVPSVDQKDITSAGKALEIPVEGPAILQLTTLSGEQMPDKKGEADFSVGEEFSEVDSYIASQMSVSEELEHSDLSCVAATRPSPGKTGFVNIENELVDFKFETLSQQPSILVDEPQISSPVESCPEIASKSENVKSEIGLTDSKSVVGTDINTFGTSRVDTHAIVDFKGDPFKVEVHELPKSQEEICKVEEKSLADMPQRSSPEKIKEFSAVGEIKAPKDIKYLQDAIRPASSDDFIKDPLIDEPSKTLETASDLDEDEFADAPLDSTHSDEIDEEWKDVESEWMSSDLKDMRHGVSISKSQEISSRENENVLSLFQTDVFSDGISSSLRAKLDLELEKPDSTASAETVKHSPVKIVSDVRMRSLSATDSEACFAEECELATDPEEVIVLHLKSILHEPKQAAVFDVSDIQETDQKLQQSLTTKSSDEFTKSSLHKADTIADFSEMSEISDFPTDSNDLKNVITMSELFTSHFGPTAESFSRDDFFSNLSTSYVTNEDYEEWEDIETDNSLEELEEANHLLGLAPQQQFFGEEMQFSAFDVSPDYAASFPDDQIQLLPVPLEQIQCFDVRDEILVRTLKANLILQTETLTDEEIPSISFHSEVENFSESMISTMTDTNDYSMAKLDSVSASITEESYESIEMEDNKELHLSQLHETACVTESLLDTSQTAVTSSVSPLVEEKEIITIQQIDGAKISEDVNVSQEPPQFDANTVFQSDEGKFSPVFTEQGKHISPVSKVPQDVEDVQTFTLDLRKDVQIPSEVAEYKIQGLSSQIASSLPELPSTDNSISFVNDDFADVSSNMVETQESGTWSDADENNVAGLEMDNAKGEDVVIPAEVEFESPISSICKKLADIRQKPLSDAEERKEIHPKKAILVSNEVISPISIIPDEQTDVLFPEHSKITGDSLQEIDSLILTSQAISMTASSTVVGDTIANASEVGVSRLTIEGERSIELSEISDFAKDHDGSYKVSIPRKAGFQPSTTVEAKSCLEAENVSLKTSKSISQLEEESDVTALKQAAMKELTATSEVSIETSLTAISSAECIESSIVTESSHSKSDVFYDISSQAVLTEELDKNFESDNSMQDLKDDDSSVKEVIGMFPSSKSHLQAVSDKDLKTAQTEEIPEAVSKITELSKSEILAIGAKKTKISETIPKPILIAESEMLDPEAQEVEIADAISKSIEILQPVILATEVQQAEISETTFKSVHASQSEVLESLAQEVEIKEVVPKSIKSEVLVIEAQLTKIEETMPKAQKAEISEAVSKSIEILDATVDREDEISTPVPEPIVILQSELLDAGAKKFQIAESTHRAEVSSFEILDVAAEKVEIKDAKVIEQTQPDVLDTGAKEDKVTLPKSTELPPSEVLESWNEDLYKEQMAYERQESDQRKFSQILTVYDFGSAYTHEDEVAEESSREITDDLYFESREPHTTENDLEESMYESWSERSFELDENILQYEQETEDEFIGDQLVYDIQDEEEEAILRAVDENLRKFSDHLSIEDDFRTSPVEDYHLEFDRTGDNIPLLDSDAYAATPEIGVFDPSLDHFTQYDYEDNSKIDSFVSISNDSTTQSKDLYSIEDEEGYIADDLYIKDDKYLLTDILEESSTEKNQHSIAFEIEEQNVEERSMLKQTSEVSETGLFVARPVNVVEDISEQNIVIDSEITLGKEISDIKEKLIIALKLEEFVEAEIGVEDKKAVTALSADHSISALVSEAGINSAKISVSAKETAEMQASSEDAAFGVTISQKIKDDKSSADENEEISLRLNVSKQDNISAEEIKSEESNFNLSKSSEVSSDITVSSAESKKLVEISDKQMVEKIPHKLHEQILETSKSADLKVSMEEKTLVETENEKIEQVSVKEKSVSSLEIEALNKKSTENLKAESETQPKEPGTSSKGTESSKFCETSISVSDDSKREEDNLKSVKTEKSVVAMQSELGRQTAEQITQISEHEVVTHSEIQAEKPIIRIGENVPVLDSSASFPMKVDKSTTEDSSTVELNCKLAPGNVVSLQKSEQEAECTDLQKKEQITEFTLKGKTKTVQSEEETFSLAQLEVSIKSKSSSERESRHASLTVKMNAEIKDEKCIEVKDEKQAEIKDEKCIEVKDEKQAEIKEDKHAEVEDKKRAEVKDENYAEILGEKHAEVEDKQLVEVKDKQLVEVKDKQLVEVKDKQLVEVKDKQLVEVKDKQLVEVKDEKLAEVEDEKLAEVEDEKLAEVEDKKRIEVEDKKRIEVEDKKRIEVEDKKRTEVEDKKSTEVEDKKSTEVEDQKLAEMEDEKHIEVEGEKHAEVKDEKCTEVIKDTSVEKSEDVKKADALVQQAIESQLESKVTEWRSNEEAITKVSKNDDEKLPELPRKRPNIQGFLESQEQEVEIPPSLPRKMSRHRLSLSDDQKPDVSPPQLEKESLETHIDTPVVIPRRRSSSVKSEDSTQEVAVQPPTRRRRSRQSEGQLRQDTEHEDIDSKVIMPRRISYDDERTILSRKDKLRMSTEERMTKLQSDGKCLSREKAFIAAKLIEMQFEEEDALNASRQCTTVYHAIKFLTQLCELCNCRFPINLMASMSHCPHKACRECLKAHFTSVIYDRSVFSLLCPVCRKPDISDSNIQDYFNHLDMMLRRILRTDVYDLFQRKLRDEVLTKDPNFHWCSQCSNGFIASPRLKKLYCPECSAITCALCHQTWELEHEGVHCERFQQWKDMHTPEPPPAGLVKKLVDRGVTCPSCGIVYPHACGGCMLYKCAHCSYKFCGFCQKSYLNGIDCKESPTCKDLGLHAHHPYNCLSFLRDIDAKDFQKLFTEAKVPYATIPAPDQIVKTRCQVREQKHLHGSVTEDRCLRDIVPYFAGLCRVHYMEYLAELLRYQKISPLPVMTTMDLQFILRKSRIFIPERVKGETLEEYHNQLVKIVTEKVPL